MYAACLLVVAVVSLMFVAVCLLFKAVVAWCLLFKAVAASLVWIALARDRSVWIPFHILCRINTGVDNVLHTAAF